MPLLTARSSGRMPKSYEILTMVAFPSGVILVKSFGHVFWSSMICMQMSRDTQVIIDISVNVRPDARSAMMDSVFSGVSWSGITFPCRRDRGRQHGRG